MTPSVPKKLIEFGWDVPSLQFFCTHHETMLQRPFDGVTLRLEPQANESQGPTPVATREGRQTVFKTLRYEEAEFAQYYRLARRIRGVPGHHFLLVWASPDEGWHWFDEAAWQNAEHNLRLFARVVREGGLQGIIFDPESYATLHPWRYSSVAQVFGGRYSYADTCQRIRYCGARTMEILQQECPDITVLMLYLLAQLPHTHPWVSLEAQREALATQEFGMLPYFLAGMLDTACGHSVIIDGNELAYYHTQRCHYALDARRIRSDLRLQIADLVGGALPNYDQHVQVGFATYYDYLMNPDHLHPWYNHRHPFFGRFLSYDERLLWLRHNTYYALTHCDSYAWWYSESMDWWRGGIPEGVEAAVAAARQAVHQGKPFEADDALAEALMRAKRTAESQPLQTPEQPC